MLNKGMLYALKKTEGKYDVYTEKPRILSVLEIISAVYQMTYDEDIIAAAIIFASSDSIDIEEIRKEFGDNIARYLMMPFANEEAWQTREESIISFLSDQGTKAQKQIILANKLCEIKQLQQNHYEINGQIFSRLGYNEDAAAKVYIGFLNAFTGLEDYEIYRQYRRIVYDLFKSHLGNLFERIRMLWDMSYDWDGEE